MIEIVVLGSGSAVPTKERNHSAVWMRYMGETFLFDCGEGTQRQLLHADLSFAKVDNICVTHWHPDHSIGLVGILRTTEMEAPQHVPTVIGPDAETNVAYMLGMRHDNADFDVPTHDVPQGGGPIMDTPYYQLRAFPTLHNTRSYGYVFVEKDRWHFDMERVEELDIPLERLEELRMKRGITWNGEPLTIGQVAERTEGKKIVYTGDTLPTENTIEAAEGADLLIHDSTYATEDDRKEGRFHATAVEAAEVAKEAGVKRLLLTHFSRQYDSSDPHLEAAREIFENTIAAEDMMRLKVV